MMFGLWLHLIPSLLLNGLLYILIVFYGSSCSGSKCSQVCSTFPLQVEIPDTWNSGNYLLYSRKDFGKYSLITAYIVVIPENLSAVILTRLLTFLNKISQRSIPQTNKIDQGWEPTLGVQSVLDIQKKSGLWPQSKEVGRIPHIARENIQL